MTKRLPLRIGLTGGIGAGKTTVSRVFSLLGVPVYYADDRAKWIMNHDEELKTIIQNAFGVESYQKDGMLNRNYLAATVFADPEKTKKINSLVHPAVGKDFEKWAKSRNEDYVLKEAALLFETGSYKDLDKTIIVTAPQDIRISRVMLRDPQRSQKDILAIIDRQLPEERKVKLADFVIDNSGEKMVIPQILDIHRKISELAQST